MILTTIDRGYALKPQEPLCTSFTMSSIYGVIQLYPSLVLTCRISVRIKSHLKAVGITAARTRVKTARGSYYRKYKEVTASQVEADLETMSMDDLYNNLKVYELEVKGISCSNLSTQNMALVSSSNNSSTNGVVNTAQAVDTANEDNKHKESTRGSVHVETPASTALVSCDGVGGYDWSVQAEEGPNYALMAYTSLTFDSKSVEERLEFFKKNEFIYLEDIKVLKVEIQMKDIAIKELRRKLQVAQKEKDGIQLTVEKLENASKSLNKLLDCEFANKPVDENTKTSKEETKEVRKNADATIIEKWITPTLSFMRFGCPVTILNTKDHLGKFDGKADEGFFVGYSLNSKAFRVFKSRTRIVEENLYIRFSEYTPNVIGSRPYWLFDIDALTRIMNYEPIIVGTQSNGFAGTKASNNTCQARKETEPVKDYILLPLWTINPPFSLDLKSSHDDRFKPSSDDGKKVDEDLSKGNKRYDQEKEDYINNTSNVNIVSSTVNVAGINEENKLPFDPDMLGLEDVGTFDFSNENEDNDAMADMNNLDTTIQVSPTPTTKIHKDHHLDQVIRDLQSATQTRNMTKILKEHRNLDFPVRVDKVEKTLYRLHQAPRAWSMIGSLMYLTSSRPDIMFAVCACARYQVNLKVSHLHAVKRIFRELKGQPKLGLWYPKDSLFDLVSYTDSDYARASLDRKSTIRGLALPTDPQHTPIILQSSSSQPQKTQKPRKPKRKNTKVPQPSGSTKYVVDEAVYKELDERLARAATTASSLEQSRTVVLELEKIKTTKALEITSLKRRAKKLEKKQRSRTHKLKRLYKVGLTAGVDSSEDEQCLGEEASKQGRKLNDIVNAASIVTTDSAVATITTDDITLAKTLVEIKTSKPKAKGTVLQEPSESTTTTTKTISSKQSQDKGKGIMVKEPMKLKKKDQIRLDEEAALKLQAEFDEEQRLAREKSQKELESNIALIET
uniref:Retroviral polymerase SH3-like domain-containing protein n=1 Tax=Tanacetum cinerariifolium TaxID=118510 RepID=A0A6L2MJ25_TANCI|nr:hypothetical protein [Tanacetum cinerariifolium]